MVQVKRVDTGHLEKYKSYGSSGFRVISPANI